MPVIAYLSLGKLNLLTESGGIRTLSSQFGEQVRQRALELRQKNEWKTQGTGARFMGAAMMGAGVKDPGAMRIAMTSICRGESPGSVLYSLETDDIAGVFALKLEEKSERRLFHDANTVLRHLSLNPGQNLIVCSQMNGPLANLVVLGTDGVEMFEVTEGDSIDINPSWVPGKSKTVVYQSAGIGRDENGNFGGQSHFSIHSVDLDSGEMATLLEDEAHDFLAPRVTADGTLYCIRRPHRKPKGEGFNPVRLLLDIILFPFRLAGAIVQWLNFFTVRYSGKPLISSQGAKQQEMDIRRMMIWDNLLDARDAARDAEKNKDKNEGLVPSSWQLVKRSPDGTVDVVAKGVLSFDLGTDGTVVYSNGNAIYRLDPSGKSERVHKGAFIEQVLWVG